MLRIIFIGFMALLAGAAMAQELSPRQEAAVRELFDSFAGKEDGMWLLNHIVQSEVIRRSADQIKNDDSLPEFGEGKLVIEFSDYQCGFCRRMFPLLNGEKVRVKVVELPVLGQLSVLAARYALAAHKQNSYADYRTSLMNRQGRLNEDILKQTAKELSLNMQQLQGDLYSQEIEDSLIKNFRLASLFDVEGTPFFIINERAVRGAVSAERLRELLSDSADG